MFMTDQPPTKTRIGQHQYAMFIPLPLFERIEERSVETGESIKSIILRSVEAALAVEA